MLKKVGLFGSAKIEAEKKERELLDSAGSSGRGEMSPKGSPLSDMQESPQMPACSNGDESPETISDELEGQDSNQVAVAHSESGSSQEVPPLPDGFELEGEDVYFSPRNRERFFVCQNLRIVKMMHDVDTNDMYMSVEFVNIMGQKVITSPILVSACRSPRGIWKLIHMGLRATHSTAKQVVEYLRYLEGIFPRQNIQKTFTRVGMGEFEQKPIFKLENAVGLDATYAGSLRLKPKGSRTEWERAIREMVIGKPALETMLCVGLSAPIIGYASKVFHLGNMVVHVVGGSSTGKTTASQLSISPFANPSTQVENGLATTWNMTDSALLQSLAGNDGLPVLLDEVAMYEHADFTKTIFRVSGGKAKKGLNPYFNPNGDGTWATTVISTGETSLCENSQSLGGLAARLIEFHDVSWTEDARSAEKLKSVIMSNYGTVGPVYGETLLNQIEGIPQRMQELHDDAVTQCRAAKADHHLLDRRAWFFAAILLAGEIANQALNLNLDCKGILKFLIANERKNLARLDMPLKAYRLFRECYQVNRDRFVTDIDQDKRSGDILLGRTMCLNGDVVRVNIIREKLDAFLQQAGFPRPLSVYREWRSRGWLDATGDHYDRPIMLSRKMGKMRMYCVLFKVEADAEDEESIHVEGSTPTEESGQALTDA